MGLKYFDNTVGAERFKRRYVWAFWAYMLGLVSGVILIAVMR